MNKYSICIVDDKIPVHKLRMDETSIINASTLKYLKEKIDDWEDPKVKEFVKNILEKEDHWVLSGFTNPSFFINSLNEELYRPDIVILDWEYPTLSEPVEKSLLTILKKTFSIIYIFTGVEKESEIHNLMNQKQYSEFSNRVYVKEKIPAKSAQILYDEIEKIRKNNFSFKFGMELRKKSLESVDKILIELGKVSLEQTVEYFKLSGDTNKDLIDFISERFKNHLTSSKFEELPEEGKSKNQTNVDIAKQLWAYRLYFYHSKSDVLVRKGDIIKNEENNKLYIVITADCDLNRFWHKKFGYLNLLPIHDFSEDNLYIRNQIFLTRDEKRLKKEVINHRKKDKNYFKVTSFSNSISNIGEGPIILPFLRLNGSIKNFIAFPMEIESIKVTIKENVSSEKKKKMSLRYDNENFKYKRIATISEPFLSPLIQHIFNTISGYGTPDYPDLISNLISENFGNIFQ